MKKIIYSVPLVIFLVICSSLYSEEEKFNLWKSFDYNMSTAEVIEELKVYKRSSDLPNSLANLKKQGKIGVKPRFARRENLDNAFFILGYCSIYSKEIWLLNSETEIEWCFDKSSSKKNINSENKLKFIQIRFFNRYYDQDAIKKKYDRWYFHISDELNLSSKEASICSGIGISEAYENGDVLFIILTEYLHTMPPEPVYRLYIQSKKDYIAGAKSRCLYEINLIKNNDDI